MLPGGWGVLAEHTLHGGRRDAMAFGDLSKTLAALTVLLGGEIVQGQRSTADVLAFQAGPPHAGPHPLDDQAAFEFGDGADDHDESAAQRAAGIDIFPERDVFDPDSIQLVQNIEEVFYRPGDSVRSPDQ